MYDLHDIKRINDAGTAGHPGLVDPATGNPKPREASINAGAVFARRMMAKIGDRPMTEIDLAMALSIAFELGTVHGETMRAGRAS